MDGNGRWAEKQRHSRIFGHVRGAKTAQTIIKYCSQIQLPFLSLFTLSAENIFRPKEEVKNLTRLLKKVFVQRTDLLLEEQIQLNILGDLSIFSSDLRELCLSLCKKTKKHKGLRLIVALNYGGRQEILQAVQKIAQAVQQNKIQPQQLDESRWASFLSSSCFPPPDMIIRTGGKVRLSNFYLWSAAYSELYFTDILWPDFSKEDLCKALQNFSSSQRKFGKL